MNASATRAKTAHERRSKGEAWQSIAVDLGYDSGKAAKFAVRRYAKKFGWTWPLSGEPSPRSTGIPIAGYSSHPEAAYRLREQGYKWQEVGARINLHSANAREIALRYARKYAKRNDQPWPPPRSKTPLLPEGGAEAYQSRSTGATWFAVGTHTGLGTKARGRAKRYAEIKKLPWPPEFETMAAKAYRLKRESPDSSWRDIAGQSGYAHSHHAGVAASRHAVELALAWMERQAGFDDPAALALAAWEAVGLHSGPPIDLPEILIGRATKIIGG